MLYSVRYFVADYSGTVMVNAADDADDAHVIALAKAKLQRQAGPFPSGPIYQSWRIVKS